MCAGSRAHAYSISFRGLMKDASELNDYVAVNSMSRWPVEAYHEEGKAEGLDKCQLRDFSATQRHVAMVAAVLFEDGTIRGSADQQEGDQT